MTSKEFILWLRGFTEGVHEFNVTPKQWDLLKEKLAKVDDNSANSGTIKMNGANSTYTYPVGGISNLTNVIDENPKTLLNG